MFDKINVYRIVLDHFQTLKDYKTRRYRIGDFAIFFLVPLAVGAIVITFVGTLGPNSITIVTTSLSIFAALLFNLLLLIYDLVRKEGSDQQNSLRKQFLREIHSNLSFSILVALISVVLSLVLALTNDSGAMEKVLSFVVYYMLSLFMLTLLMVLKRVHVLLASELTQS